MLRFIPRDAMGRKPVKSEAKLSERLVILISRDEKQALEDCSNVQKRSVGRVVRDAIRVYLETFGEPKKEHKKK
jgi:hypothetical protein